MITHMKIQGSRFRVQGSGFKVQGSRFRVQGSGFKVQGSMFGVRWSMLQKPNRSEPNRTQPNLTEPKDEVKHQRPSSNRTKAKSPYNKPHKNKLLHPCS